MWLSFTYRCKGLFKQRSCIFYGCGEGVSLQQVCVAVRWSSSHTFIKCYSLDVCSTPGSHVHPSVKVDLCIYNFQVRSHPGVVIDPLRNGPRLMWQNQSLHLVWSTPEFECTFTLLQTNWTLKGNKQELNQNKLWCELLCSSAALVCFRKIDQLKLRE